jgi:plastocyanin
MKKHSLTIVLVLACNLIAVIPLHGIEVSGHVRGLSARGLSKPTTIVYAESLDSHNPPKPGIFQMAQKDKAFVPHILAIPVGSKVDFPNHDPIFHNVFTQSEPGRFNLGMYRSGQWKSHTFPEPAIYYIFCKIHPQMAAIILVLPTSLITQADASGNYQLDLPAGRYRITVWAELTRSASTEFTVSTDAVEIPDLVLAPATGIN